MQKRQSLKDMTPGERVLHRREQGRLRKASERARKREKDQKALHILAPELREFVEELLKLSIREASWALALWEKEMKQPFPKIDRPTYAPGMDWNELSRMKLKWARWEIIRYFAADAFARDSGRKRGARFDAKESLEAAEMGLSVSAYRLVKRRRREDAASAAQRNKVLSRRQAA